jgi:pyruvate dehydrogenase E2 component (dihydrolipoamide acetyltransferase)
VLSTRIDVTKSSRGLPVKETIRLKHIRKIMAQTMKTSVDTAALSQVTREVDVTALNELRHELQPQTAVKLSLNSMIMVAVAHTLPAHPLLNAELIEQEIVVYDAINLGMAVAGPEGLVVVVIHNANQLSVMDMALSITGKVEKARCGTLKLEDVEGGTFTVSNLGMYGVDGGFPLPRPPEGAILLIGAARPKPAVIDGNIQVRHIGWFSLSFDHRFIDGGTAARFLQDLTALISNPKILVPDSS